MVDIVRMFFCVSCQKNKASKKRWISQPSQGQKTKQGICYDCRDKKKNSSTPQAKEDNIQKETKSKRGRPRMKFSILSERSKQRILLKARLFLEKISGGDLQALILALMPVSSYMIATQLKKNITRFSKIYKSSLSDPNLQLTLLTLGLPPSLASQISAIPLRSLHLTRNKLRNEIFFRKTQLIQNPNPNHMTTQELEWFKQMALDMAPVQSGKNERRLPFVTYSDFHKEYEKLATQNNFSVRSIPTVIGILKSLKIKRAYFDKYSCELCYEGRIAEANHFGSVDGSSTLEKYFIHKDLFQHQLKMHKNQRENLGDHQLFFIYDYSTFHEFSKKKFRDLSMMVIWKGEYHFFDSVASEKHDFKFTEAAWTLTISKLIASGINFGEGIRELIIWSDGGLKTKENIFFFLRLARALKVNIFLNFFAPHHGHNLVDGHFGQAKNVLRWSSRGGPITTEDQIFEAIQSLPNTTLQKITPIQPKFVVKPLAKQIRRWFEWMIDLDGNLFCRERTGAGVFSQQRIVYNIVN